MAARYNIVLLSTLTRARDACTGSGIAAGETSRKKRDERFAEIPAGLSFEEFFEYRAAGYKRRKDVHRDREIKRYAEYLRVHDGSGADALGKASDSRDETAQPSASVSSRGASEPTRFVSNIDYNARGQRTLIIPSDLGYGSRGAGSAIPPTSDTASSRPSTWRSIITRSS